MSSMSYLRLAMVTLIWKQTVALLLSVKWRESISITGYRRHLLFRSVNSKHSEPFKIKAWSFFWTFFFSLSESGDPLQTGPRPNSWEPLLYMIQIAETLRVLQVIYSNFHWLTVIITAVVAVQLILQGFKIIFWCPYTKKDIDLNTYKSLGINSHKMDLLRRIEITLISSTSYVFSLSIIIIQIGRFTVRQTAFKQSSIQQINRQNYCDCFYPV